MLERGVRRGKSMEKKGVSECLERSVRVKGEWCESGLSERGGREEGERRG